MCHLNRRRRSWWKGHPAPCILDQLRFTQQICSQKKVQLSEANLIYNSYLTKFHPLTYTKTWWCQVRIPSWLTINLRSIKIKGNSSNFKPICFLLKTLLCRLLACSSLRKTSSSCSSSKMIRTSPEFSRGLCNSWTVLRFSDLKIPSSVTKFKRAGSTWTSHPKACKLFSKSKLQCPTKRRSH